MTLNELKLFFKNLLKIIDTYFDYILFDQWQNIGVLESEYLLKFLLES